MCNNVATESFNSVFKRISTSGYPYMKDGHYLEHSDGQFTKRGTRPVAGFENTAAIHRKDRFCAIDCSDGSQEIGVIRNFTLSVFAYKTPQGEVFPVRTMDKKGLLESLDIAKYTLGI